MQLAEEISGYTNDSVFLDALSSTGVVGVEGAGCRPSCQSAPTAMNTALLPPPSQYASANLSRRLQESGRGLSTCAHARRFIRRRCYRSTTVPLRFVGPCNAASIIVAVGTFPIYHWHCCSYLSSGLFHRHNAAAPRPYRPFYSCTCTCLGSSSPIMSNADSAVLAISAFVVSDLLVAVSSVKVSMHLEKAHFEMLRRWIARWIARWNFIRRRCGDDADRSRG